MDKVYMISGKARHGKDTVANYLKNMYENIGKKVIILQVSYPLKYYASKALDWDFSEENKPREFLQNIGTNFIRNEMGETFLIDRLVEDIKVLSNYCNAIIVSDVRFPIEFNVINSCFSNVVNIYIDRPNFDNNLLNQEKEHTTETALDGFNDYKYIIKNDGSLEDLKEKTQKIFKEEVK